MTSEAKRIETTNAERFQLAQQSGWRFRPDAPELVDAWRVLPFTQHGDQRIAFGAVDGGYYGMPFAMFDFHRRPTVTHVHDRWTKKEINAIDTVRIDSVWVVKLPAAMPYFQIVTSIGEDFGEIEHYPEPPTPDRKFNRWYRLIGTDPQYAAHLLHPQLAAFMRKAKMHTWALAGDDLIYAEHPTFGRTKPDDILETLGKLGQLVSLLPLHLGTQPSGY